MPRVILSSYILAVEKLYVMDDGVKLDTFAQWFKESTTRTRW